MVFAGRDKACGLSLFQLFVVSFLLFLFSIFFPPCLQFSTNEAKAVLDFVREDLEANYERDERNNERNEEGHGKKSILRIVWMNFFVSAYRLRRFGLRLL